MNRKHLTAALILIAAAGAALADDITVDAKPFTSSRTRAEVRAEQQQYRQEGVNPWAHFYEPLHFFHSTTDRKQVRTEFLAARGEVAASNAEDGGAAHAPPAARSAATRTSINAR